MRCGPAPVRASLLPTGRSRPRSLARCPPTKSPPDPRLSGWTCLNPRPDPRGVLLRVGAAAPPQRGHRNRGKAVVNAMKATSHPLRASQKGVLGMWRARALAQGRLATQGTGGERTPSSVLEGRERAHERHRSPFRHQPLASLHGYLQCQEAARRVGLTQRIAPRRLLQPLLSAGPRRSCGVRRARPPTLKVALLEPSGQ